MPAVVPEAESTVRVYWTAFIGLFFDYYDLFLFIYLEKTLAAEFALSPAASNAVQFTGLAGVGVGALLFGFLADRFGRGRMMLAVFAVYAVGIAGLSLTWDFNSLLAFRLLASLALGAEWGISHTYLAERVPPGRRYRLSALLQFSILGGLLAALVARYALPAAGWRVLFAASIVPVAVLSLVRWRMLAGADSAVGAALRRDAWGKSGHKAPPKVVMTGGAAFRFAGCFALASLTISSGTINIFFAKELPQTVWHTVLFWGNVAPGMLLGAWLVRRRGVRAALLLYGGAVVALSLGAWLSPWAQRKLAFALVLPLLNGIPFGLMGALFNETFAVYRTTLSGAAYNLGRILAGFAPVLLVALGLNDGGRYFLFTAATGLGVCLLAGGLHVPAADSREISAGSS
ncbi:MAG: MFS transporter [Opitutae bacterium]|nr:MFS transporter [Opitutae bacterium]